ncbi:hypothetical protein KVR01_010082 [Diaporthe batatas]|uniref:uncharacterized protein n=1 Tax=Diaporthe batatas TaxID=748121 RepID=UPI001D03F2D9|nr:uncharacterized protein KVR01_010082 [Diaporthe batatas]KAG8160546.1 hypothetical protein KVR01_010082 [Diaporthe batatas]
MSSNNDNVMARFLFAILQQKNLKDIDWNAVAHNPILAQEITNGHAARMRYSRFRNSLLNIEPQRRNRAGAGKSKITKSKKETKAKKENEQPIKDDPNARPRSQEDEPQAPKAPPPKIKDENRVKRELQQTPSEACVAEPDVPHNPLPDTQIQFHNRLLTPCSDSDLFAISHGYATSPASDVLRHEQAQYDYTGAAAHCGHESASWQPSPSYSPFAMPTYEMDTYNAPASAFCDHQHITHPEGFGIAPSAMMAPDQPQALVKHEEWDNRFH